VKLLSKLTLSITLSKLGIVLLFVVILPFIVENIASDYTNYNLRQQKEAVMKSVASKGVNYYLDGEDSYGSYTMDSYAEEDNSAGQTLFGIVQFQFGHDV